MFAAEMRSGDFSRVRLVIEGVQSKDIYLPILNAAPCSLKSSVTVARYSDLAAILPAF